MSHSEMLALGNLGSMNIKEVAARARLSTATVTINQSELVRPLTAEKVQRAIDRRQ
jgi:DNA-binding LacI/PurR family transcriptional regulator